MIIIQFIEDLINLSLTRSLHYLLAKLVCLGILLPHLAVLLLLFIPCFLLLLEDELMSLVQVCCCLSTACWSVFQCVV